MTTVEVLQKARALVEKGWTQGRYAVDARGHTADIWGTFRLPVAFCMTGALYRVTPDGDRSAPVHWLMQAIGDIPTPWNDTPGRTQAEVIAAFTKAIELASASPAAGPLAPAVQDQERKP